MKAWVIVAAVLLSGCQGALRGGTLNGGQPERFIYLAVTDASGAIVTGATGTLTVAGEASVSPCATDRLSGELRLICYTKATHGDASLVVHAAGYADGHRAIADVSEPNQGVIMLRRP